MRTGFHTGFFADVPVLDAIKQIQDSGFDGAELNAETLPWANPHISPSTSRGTIDKIAATGAVTSIAAHRKGLADPDPDIRRRAIEWTLDLARISVDIGAPLIHVIAGDDRSDSELGKGGRPGDMASFIEALRTIVDEADKLGVTVGLEPIVNQLVSSTDETIGMLDAIPNLGVSFDPSHLEVATHDVTDAARRLGDRVVIAALKDAQGSPDEFSFPGLGQGDIDFVEMLTTLVGRGFSGPLIVEYEAHAFGDKRGIQEVLQQSYRFTQELLERTSDIVH